ncbi:S-layer family protein [Calothrix sp. FACHB-1219]|uniref:two-partner secretion domain-containing protein n=1 Tax=unclassified Calothrix TaxID=2619626 RepID=UPI001684FF8C|nr:MULTISPECIES: S-layer family protein [unclassified Calothrix]MBD2201049.1 S-layer family protein [Calothrix sp. FACHB-168]MBD2215482.1 S-layer family protein [Calothrix sp. FACHB-1219]
MINHSLYLLMGFLAIAFFNYPAVAQITKDDTLGTESSVITPNVTIKGAAGDRIDGGAIRDTNLFHSFQEFNIEEGKKVYFANPTGITQIFSRITGSNSSNILGTLGVDGNANLFLINPNGIVFGRNAKLDINGSFIASTASNLKFADGYQFSTAVSSTKPLLTVSAPIGLQFGANPGSIVNRAINGLEVQPEKTLALVGGDVILEAGIVRAIDGRIELGSVAGNSLVNLTPIVTGYSLGYQGVQEFQNISLSQQANVVTSGNTGDNIQVQSRRLQMSDGSKIQVNTLGTGTDSSLTVNAADSIEVIGAAINGQNLSSIATTTNSTGDGASLIINTPVLKIRDGAQVYTFTNRQGKGGNLTVNAPNSVELSGTGLYPSVLIAVTQGPGNAGTLTINTPVLLIRDGAEASSSTISDGRGGNVIVNASELIQVIGVSANNKPSALIAVTQGQGDAGSLTINTPVLQVLDGAQVSSSTRYFGKGGNLTVNATKLVQVRGIAANGQSALLVSQTEGKGDAGSLTINTPVFQILDGAQVGSGTFGAGKGGSSTINATELVQIRGTTPNNQRSSGLFASTRQTGDAGSLTINTPILQILDGALISASTFGSGRGGTVAVNASKSVEVIGTSANGLNPSKIDVQANRRATGDAGALTITAPVLLVRDGGQISTNTFGLGKAGTLTINASQLVQLTGTSANQQISSGLFAQTENQGDGGSLTMQTPELLISQGAQATVGSKGEGIAGNLSITADKIRLDNSKITAQTRSTNGGNITLDIKDFLLLRHNSQISTTAGTANAGGDGGNITIQAPFIVSVAQENSDITADAFQGRGGKINISTQGVFGLQFRERQTDLSDITASSQFGVAGVVEISNADVDPSQGLTELPKDVVNVAGLINQNLCVAASQGSEFIVTGRGGLPASPREVLNPDTAWEDWRIVQPEGLSTTAAITNHQQQHQPDNAGKIVEAQGWVKGGDGAVRLITEPVVVTPKGVWLNIPNCQGLREKA